MENYSRDVCFLFRRAPLNCSDAAFVRREIRRDTSYNPEVEVMLFYLINTHPTCKSTNNLHNNNGKNRLNEY